jgi:hypothetical protein
MAVQFCLTAALTTRELTRGSSISGGRQPAGGWTGGPTVGIGGLAASHLTSPVRLQRGTTSFLVYREGTSSPEGFATVFQWFSLSERPARKPAVRAGVLARTGIRPRWITPLPSPDDGGRDQAMAVAGRAAAAVFSGRAGATDSPATGSVRSRRRAASDQRVLGVRSWPTGPFAQAIVVWPRAVHELR